jgi:hypothetical protein
MPTGLHRRNFRYCVWHIQEPPRQAGARVNLRSTRLARFVLITLTPLALVSCGGNKNIAREDQCREQVVLSLSPGVLRTGREMDRLEDGADVKLKYVRSSSPTLFVYSLSASGRDPGCRSALSRLRQDSHVRFVEPSDHRTVRGFE